MSLFPAFKLSAFRTKSHNVQCD